MEVVERGVLVNLLSERRPWPVAELEQRINSEQFAEAVARLEEVGLVIRESESITASPAAIRGDDLAL
jgi:predicted transcriptional regulator